MKKSESSFTPYLSCGFLHIWHPQAIWGVRITQWRKFGDSQKLGFTFVAKAPVFIFLFLLAMARPRKNNAEYFSHDANMRSDRKIIALRAKYGLEGYAIRCMVLETLAWAENFTISFDEMEIELLAWDFWIDSDLFAGIVDYMVRINLLQVQWWLLSCSQLVESLEPLLNKREKYREKVAWNSSPPVDEDLDNQNEVLETETKVPETKNPHSKVKHRKAKNSIEKYKKHSRVVHASVRKLNLTQTQEQELISIYGESIVHRYKQKLLNYITSKWDPYESHYHTLLVRFDKDAIKPQMKTTTLQVEITPMDPKQRAHAKQWLMLARQRLLGVTKS